MIYSVGRRIFSFGLKLFFRRIKVVGAERIEKGPLLVICNHPNFLLDSLIVTSIYKRPFWYLAKATLFKTGLISALLKTCHLIPIYRRQDNPDELSKNKAIFKFAAQTLQRGNGLVIFPEGISLAERRLKPLKTGAARISFLAEEESSFKLGLRIQPVGITYTDIDQFRSGVTVVVAEAVELKDYISEFQQDAAATVRKLTEKLESILREITVEVEEPGHEPLVEKIAKIFESRGRPLHDHERLKLIARNVNLVTKSSPQVAAEFSKRIEQYLELLAIFGIEGEEALEVRRNKMFICVLAPLIIFGFVLHVIPYQIINWLAHQRSKSPVDLGSMKFSTGLLLFPLWYILITFFLWYLALPFEIIILLLALMLLSGYIAQVYFWELRLLLIMALWPTKRNPLNVLCKMRDELISALESLRQE